jgi:hypothetical protein
MKWHIIWVGWALLTLLLEALGLKKGKPLTRSVRTYIIRWAAGCAATGGLLVWLIFHFLFDAGSAPLHHSILAVATGIPLGLLGWVSLEANSQDSVLPEPPQDEETFPGSER